MNCPSCLTERLVMTDRQGVEIDYCPACRGIWLDRGELDKLLDRATPPAPAGAQPAPGDARSRPRRRDRDDDDDHRDRDDDRYDDDRFGRDGRGRKGRRRGVLSEILDFG